MNRWARLLIAVIAAILAIVILRMLFISAPASPPREETQVAEPAATPEATGPDADSAPKPQPSSAAAPSSTHLEDQVFTATSLTELTKCLPGLSKPRSMSDLLSMLEARLGRIVSRHTNSNIVHIQLPSGDKRRLQLVGGKLKIFAEDEEGLPVPLQLDPEYKDLKPEEAFERYRARGQKTFEDIEESVQFASGAGANLTIDDGMPEQIHVFLNDRSLGCAIDDDDKLNDCRCLIPEPQRQ